MFHKVGIGTLDEISRRRGGGCDRLYRHYRDGAQLISSLETDLLTCLIAERMILKHVASRAYTPRETAFAEATPNASSQPSPSACRHGQNER